MAEYIGADDPFAGIRANAQNAGDWSNKLTNQTEQDAAAKVFQQQQEQQGTLQGLLPNNGTNNGDSNWTWDPSKGPVSQSDLTTIKTGSNNANTTVNKQAATAFRGFLDELDFRGYRVNSVNGYNPRKIAGTDKWSAHAGGYAIDINPGRNPVTYGKVKTDMPPWMNSLANKYGLFWGGNWKGNKKDPMHFTYGKSY
jgi:type II secretory pathway pseudopilin PulG